MSIIGCIKLYLLYINFRLIFILNLLGIYLLCHVSSGRQRSWFSHLHVPFCCYFSQKILQHSLTHAHQIYLFLLSAVLLSLNLPEEYHIFKHFILHEFKLLLPDVIKILFRAIFSTISTFLSCSVYDILRKFLSNHISVALNSVLSQGADSLAFTATQVEGYNVTVEYYFLCSERNTFSRCPVN